jgi:Ni/Co efflux regulator RcnB
MIDMRRSLLLSAAVAVCLALPVASLADPPSDNAKNKGGQDQQQHGQGRGQGQGKGQGQGQGKGQGGQGGGQGKGGTQGGSAAKGPSAGAVLTTGGAGNGGAGAHGGAFSGASGVKAQQFQLQKSSQFQSQSGGQPTRGATGGTPSTSGVVRSFGGSTPRRTTATAQNVQAAQPLRRGGQPQTPNIQSIRRPQPTPLAGWSQTVRGAARDQAGQQWRQGHQGWDQNAPWRQDSNWWRSSPSFRLFSGPRIGYFFIPELGYVSAPAEYQKHYWRTGEYLPDWFWRYQVRDYDRYGLPQPPDGCVWIWLDGDVALMDASDGYIIDIVRNLW